MPCYLSEHTLACLPRQAVAEIVRRLYHAAGFKLRLALVNMQEGKLLIEIEAPSREAIEELFKVERLYPNSLLRVEYEARDGELEVVP